MFSMRVFEAYPATGITEVDGSCLKKFMSDQYEQ